MPTFTQLYQWPFQYLENPYVILWIIPIFFLIYFILKKQFVNLREDDELRRQKKLTRRMMLWTRTIIILLVLIAIATPFAVREREFKGDPFVKILVDNSTSMELFDYDFNALESALKKKLNVEVKVYGSETTSNLGDALLEHLEPDASMLVLSDGQVNSGAALGDVALLATKLNATINGITLQPARNDVAIEIVGPGKTLESLDNTFGVQIHPVGNVNNWHVRITLDNAVIYDQTTSDTLIPIKKTLTPGYHRLQAELIINDHFEENNIFTKSIKAVSKPKIFFLTDNTESPILTLYRQLYKVDAGPDIPSNLNPYYALVANNVHASKIDNRISQVTEFVVDGDGLIVLGGRNSYDFGGYFNSVTETILPVFVSSAEREEGNVNVALVMDISGSTGAQFGSGKTVDVEKSLAVSVIRDLALENKVGMIAFNTEAFTVASMRTLFEHGVEIEDKIARVQDGGGTWINVGIARAISMLAATSGAKNIILISDGNSQTESTDIVTAQAAANNGIKIYTVGVGPQTNEKHMQRIADQSGGIYFRAEESSRIKILFGDLEEEKKKAEKNVVILNSNHFITAGVEPTAKIYGFNQVVPKGAGRLLVTTDSGDPLVTSWRLGLGKVVAVSTDDGTGWAGQLLSAPDSKLHTRILNWAVGDPDRKANDFIDITDARIGEPSEILIRSPSGYPEAEGYTFYKVDEDLYSASVFATETGFQKLLDGEFSVNYAREYENLGQNIEFMGIVQSTGGKMFDIKDIDGIVEHTKASLRRSITAKDPIRIPFLLAALIIFLAEILIRRIIRRE